MPSLERILLVDDAPAEWHLALSSIADDSAKAQTAVVKNKDEALDFLHARGTFRRRAAGLPAVVVVGPSVRTAAAFALLKDIRADAVLHCVPVVIIATAPDEQLVKSAYEQGVNSLVSSHQDLKIRGENYAALALFWGWANEPPPSRLPVPEAQRVTP